MREYQDLGHMQPVSHNVHPSVDYYIPHHPVFKPTSTSTKTRVVFDASAKTSSGVSLNDIMLVGPVVQRDLFSILAQFRMYQYVFTSDISKMYRQVLIAPEHRPFQRILWREDPSLDIQEFELNTVSYGTAAATF